MNQPNINAQHLGASGKASTENNEYIMPADIRREYEGQHPQQFILLSFLRPHCGSQIDASANTAPDETPAPDQMPIAGIMQSTIRTAGFDILLVLLRFLLTQGLIIPDTICAEAKLFMEAAWSNLGWNEFNDFHVKRNLFISITGHTGRVTPQDWVKQKSNLVFERLLHNTKLRELIIENDDFRFFSDFALVRPKKDATIPWTVKRISGMASSILHTLKPWDGSTTLVEHIYSRLNILTPSEGEESYGPIAAGPRFICVLFEAKEHTRSFMDVIDFRLENDIIWEKDGEPVKDRQNITYQLCAIIRLATDSPEDIPDDIRVYRKNGTEIESFTSARN
ncbi:hypothetical protein BDZ45DRAFT_432278 [Acephala macrosclerotiorum]|nr:hypothetical protein BDZ45DRAFT_432278 [Acephala macrosclerotiorum]